MSQIADCCISAIMALKNDRALGGACSAGICRSGEEQAPACVQRERPKHASRNIQNRNFRRDSGTSRFPPVRGVCQDKSGPNMVRRIRSPEPRNCKPQTSESQGFFGITIMLHISIGGPCGRSTAPTDQNGEKPNAGLPSSEGTKAVDAPATGPATAEQLTEVEEQMTGFEKSTLRWAKTAVIMSGLAALFVCGQWWEMHKGSTDTHNLAAAAGSQATAAWNSGHLK